MQCLSHFEVKNKNDNGNRKIGCYYEQVENMFSCYPQYYYIQVMTMTQVSQTHCNKKEVYFLPIKKLGNYLTITGDLSCIYVGVMDHSDLEIK